MDSGKQMCLLCLTKESKEIERKLESVFENNNNGMVLEALNELFGLKVSKYIKSKIKSSTDKFLFVLQITKFDRRKEICLECKVNLLQSFIFTRKIKDIRWKENNKCMVKQENLEVIELSSNDGRYCKEEGETSESDSDEERPTKNGIDNTKLESLNFSTNQLNSSTSSKTNENGLETLHFSPNHQKSLSLTASQTTENVKNGLAGPGDRIMQILTDYNVTSQQMCKIFSDVLQNQSHVAIKQPKYNGKHICATCSVEFSNDYVLKNHIKYHHLKVYHYVCDVCKRAYINKHTLEKHTCTRSHIGRPPKMVKRRKIIENFDFSD